MAHTLSAQKRARQNLKKHMVNKAIKSRIKTQVKKLRALIAQNKDAALLKEELRKLYRLVDKAAAKSVIHKNRSARLKSRLALVSSKGL
jgi:small subunit ribosomal protein S20